MKNEHGIILPLTLCISLIIALLLLHFAQRLESQVRTYELEQHHLLFTILEKECLSFIINELSDPDLIPTGSIPTKTILLHNGTSATFTYTNGIESLDVTYKFLYNEYLGQRTVEYHKKQHTYVLK